MIDIDSDVSSYGYYNLLLGAWLLIACLNLERRENAFDF